MVAFACLVSSGSRRRFACLVAGAALSACASVDPVPPSHPMDVFRTSTGTVVEIPRKQGAPGFNADAAQLASQMRQLDVALAAWQLPAGAVAPDLAAELQRVVRESRDSAVDTIALAYRISERTSGPLDGRLVGSASETVKSLQDAVKASPGSFKWRAVTFISAEAGASIHYVSGAEFAGSGTPSWQSYSKGEALRIGRYMFRVQPADASRRPFLESITILQDPFSRALVPIRL